MKTAEPRPGLSGFRIAAATGVAALLIVAAVAAYLGIGSWLSKRAEVASAKRERRVAPAAEFAPLPLASAEPMTGGDGVDAWGYPEKRVDRVAIRSLLQRRKFAELTELFEKLQSDFEADNAREYWPIDAATSFGSAEQEQLVLLDAWVAATPSSFAPYLARGAHWTATGFARRGTHWVKDTHGSDLKSMEEAMAKASGDLERALQLRPKVVAAHRLLIQTAMATGQPAVSQKAIAEATTACPSCFQVRVTYLFALTPRWGGSHQQMRAFARASPIQQHPHLRLLEGYVDHDQASQLFIAKRYDDARAAIDRACALGDHWEFFLERGDIEKARGNHEAALADLNRADALRPDLPDILSERAAAHFALKHWEQAGRDLLRVLQQNPTHVTGREQLQRVVSGLVFESSERMKAGQREDALRVINLAADLAPTSRDVSAQKMRVVEGGVKPDASSIAVLEQRVRDNPDDFGATQQLDYVLAKQHQFDRIIELWTSYLSRHPDDGRAHLERGGAYMMARKFAEAHADATKACELGVTEGCARAKQIAPRLN